MKNANLASLYIGTLQEESLHLKQEEIMKAQHNPFFFWVQLKTGYNILYTHPRYILYHDIKVSPILSQTVKTATKILQHKGEKKVGIGIYHLLFLSFAHIT